MRFHCYHCGEDKECPSITLYEANCRDNIYWCRECIQEDANLLPLNIQIRFNEYNSTVNSFPICPGDFTEAVRAIPKKKKKFKLSIKKCSRAGNKSYVQKQLMKYIDGYELNDD